MIWSPSIYMARLTNSFERGLNHLFLPELFPSFPPSERGKLIPHSHSPNRAERHSAIILQQVPPIVIVSKTPFCCLSKTGSLHFATLSEYVLSARPHRTYSERVAKCKD